MSRITASLGHDQVKVLFLFGTNMLSSFPDAGQLAAGLRRADLVVTYDLFLNDTARRYADVILPASFWLEEIGCKMTHTHVYLMEKGLDPPGQAHPLGWVLAALAQRLGLSGFYPWGSEEEIVDAILDHPCTGHATVNSLRAQGGIRALRISRVSYPGRQFPTPSGKVEFYSARALDLGLPPLPVYEEQPAPAYPLALCHGRTLTHFHSFYDHGRALPSLAPVDPEPRLWLAPPDAAARGIKDGDRIRIYNEQGDFQAHARVTEKIPAGAVWIRDGWEGLNRLTSCRPVLPDQAVDIFGFSAGQASFQAMVEVAPVSPSQAVAQMPSHP
jgi:anaerobic selenocysteine-containing dehydrogenase